MADGMQTAAFVNPSKLSSMWLAVVLIFVVVSLATLAARPSALLPDKPLTEDGFYQLTVARNLALGHGLTIDGTQKTNGFQPLFTVLFCSPCYWLSGAERLSTLRLVLLVHTGLQVATAWCLAAVVRATFHATDDRVGRQAYWLVMLLTLGSVALVMEFHNGLETGLLHFLYAFTWRMYQRIGVSTLKACAIIGGCLGLLTLARVDAAFMAVTIAVSQLLTREPLLRRGSRFVVIAAGSFIVSSPWWTYNLLTFGSLMPISGTAQQRLGFGVEKLHDAIGSIAQVMTPSIYLSRFEGDWSTGLRAIVIVVGIIYAIRWIRLPKQVLVATAIQERTLSYAACFAVTYALLIAYYVLSSGATWFYTRYFSPVALLAIFVMARLLSSLGERQRRGVLILATLLAMQTPLICCLAWTDACFKGNLMYRDQLKLVSDVVPSTAKVSAYQSGTLGYFRDHVVNLDGKVNPDALLYRRNIAMYLDQEAVSWYCDNYPMVCDETRRQQWQVIERWGTFVLYHRLHGQSSRSSGSRKGS
jgi:hypothetical protein